MRMSVSRSRPCKFGASSLVGLTRVCNAIRSALVVKWEFACAGSHHVQIIPEVWPWAGILAALSQRIKLFYDLVKLGFALTNHAGGSFLEGLLGRNAIEPALFGELFVAGKIEADQQVHFAVCRRGFFRGFRFLGFVFCLGLRLWFLGFRRLGGFVGLLRRRFGLILGAFELVLQLFVEAEGLLPAFEFVAG